MTNKKIFHLVTFTLIFVTISGCTSVLKSPHIAYTDNNAYLNQTAVLSVYDDNQSPVIEARIVSVDGIKVPASYWVRVKPGKHKFEYRYLVNASWNLSQSSFTQAYFTSEIEDMQPKHVYVIRLSKKDGKVNAEPEDLGTNSKYGIPFGLGKKYFYPEF